MSVRFLNLVAEICVFVGLALIGYVAWTLWGTGLETQRAQQTYREDLEEAWSNPPAATPDSEPTEERAADGAEPTDEAEPRDDPPARLGDAMALLRIPALGEDWEWVVLDGTDPETLTQGIGHQPDTAMAGEVGNFVLAGHRASYGEPFAYLPDNVGAGDTVEVETRDAIYTYRVTRTKHTTPTDVAVMEPVPEQPGVRPEDELITLITCTPRYGSTGRWIVFGELVDTREREAVR